MTEALTDTYIKKATEKVDNKVVRKCRPGTTTWDAHARGLGLRVTPKGKYVWILKLIFPGHRTQTRRTLGEYPGLSIADARIKAREWRDQVREHKRDPKEVAAEREAAAERERDKAKVESAVSAGNTFGKVAVAYITQNENQRQAKNSAREIRRVLIKAWDDVPIADISADMVRELIHTTARRAPFEAWHAWSHAATMFKWAFEEKLIQASPCASIDKKLLFKPYMHKLGPRKRMLSNEELAALWPATIAAGYPGGSLTQWLLLTGSRVSGGTGARWREFPRELRQHLRQGKRDWASLPEEARRWTVPEERHKSEQTHIVPLTDTMLDVLATLPLRDEDSLVFSNTGEAELTGSLSTIKKGLDAYMLDTLRERARQYGDKPEKVKLPRWTMHDFRRVVTTHLAELDIAEEVAERVVHS